MAPASKAAEEKLTALAQRWADGKASLRDVRGYTEEELYLVARMAYLFYYQGKLDEARTLFQGLYAVDPSDGYVARALGVVELAAGNNTGALAAYDVAVKLNPRDAAAYVGRAEVRIAMGERALAVQDLRQALEVEPEGDLADKSAAVLETLKTARLR
ncbi:MAG: tetratricopeptide repeat protein [Myxococcaceae bacterium]